MSPRPDRSGTSASPLPGASSTILFCRACLKAEPPRKPIIRMAKIRPHKHGNAMSSCHLHHILTLPRHLPRHNKNDFPPLISSDHQQHHHHNNCPQPTTNDPFSILTGARPHMTSLQPNSNPISSTTTYLDLLLHSTSTNAGTSTCRQIQNPATQPVGSPAVLLKSQRLQPRPETTKHPKVPRSYA